MIRTLALLAALGVVAVAQTSAPESPAPEKKAVPAAVAPVADLDANAPAGSPAQNRKAAKQFPPAGVAISAADRFELTLGAGKLRQEIARLELSKMDDRLRGLMPDVEIYHKAVDWALRYDEFYNAKEVGVARELLKEGLARVAALREGKAPWTTQTGLVVRGFRSHIDDSVQPFGAVVPSTWKGTEDKTPRALWVWNHGRGETLTELAFINECSKKSGEFTPPDTFVIRPYGRYCNATKFAGETDVFEALNHAEYFYPVDKNRLVNAGFSMGGASAWHLGAHYPFKWAVSHAGAGFAETAEYAGVFAAGKTPPPWWEVILYRWYDVTGVAANFGNHPMLAYHGSEDKQGQATEIMKRFAAKEDVTIQEFIGPGVAHKYEPKTKKTIEEKIADVLGKAGDGCVPTKPHFTTFSLVNARQYGIPNHVALMRMERQWERADYEVEWAEGRTAVTLKTKNVAQLNLFMAAQYGKILPKNRAEWLWKIAIDGEALELKPERSPMVILEKTGGKWTAREGSVLEAPKGNDGKAAKNPLICGPIDDAFMSSFIFVKPTGTPLSPALGEWTQRELAFATKQWRGIFRGEVPVVDDTEYLPGLKKWRESSGDPQSELGDGQFIHENLILWGDPSSNAVLKQIADKLPVKWTAEGVEFGGKKYGPGHVPILIFPNPLNPEHYVVLNSGFTFSRAAASGTNSLQTPKLPDWAIVDISVPPDDKFPGKVVDAGFFDEQWKFTAERPK